MELQVVESNGNKTSKIKVDASVFGIKPNKDAVHRAILSEMEAKDATMILRSLKPKVVGKIFTKMGIKSLILFLNN